jgi:hypothetical protein
MKPGDFVNMELLSHPMNWVVVWFMALVWLFAIHFIVQGWTGTKKQSFNNGPLPQGTVLPPAPMQTGYAGGYSGY